MTESVYASYGWQEWVWLCLFVSGAFYMTIDVSRRITSWLLSRALPTRYIIPIGQGDEQNRVTVWAYTFERAVIKAAAKDAHQYVLDKLGWSLKPTPWISAWPQNLKWLLWGEWKARLEYRQYDQGETDELLAALIEIFDQPWRNHWANRRDLWLLCLRSAELEVAVAKA
ncbi:hypothetical protein [Oceanobacter mangrovi]|uniref:hypothetical protein n=1 Tax=Oceanobacter mangrovi TaxID=2862510 RepID=UPI001C8D0B95|nr:hypothetical protein [Oceanobacter mangrovi]